MSNIERLKTNLDILEAIETLEYHNRIFLTTNNALMCSEKREMLKDCKNIVIDLVKEPIPCCSTN